MDIERPTGPRARRVIEALNAEWSTATAQRAEIAAECRLAAAALERTADAYERGTMRDVALAINPVVGILANLVNSVQIGRAIRRSLDRRDVAEN